MAGSLRTKWAERVRSRRARDVTADEFAFGRGTSARIPATGQRIDQDGEADTPAANSLLSQREHGKRVLRLMRALPDGRETLQLNPAELMRPLAGLVSRPRVQQIHYFGVFASHSAMRARVILRRPMHTSGCACEEEEAAGQLELPLVPRPVLGRRCRWWARRRTW
jgi:hypothetical protein